MDAPTAMTGANLTLLWQTAASFLAGLVLGIIHFSTLGRLIGEYLGGHCWRAALLQVARMALVVTVFYLLVRWGAVHVLAGALGLLGARSAIMRRVRRTP